VTSNITIPIAAVIPATPRALLVQLNLEKKSFPFNPGQAIVIGQHGLDLKRPYSIACSPEQAASSRMLEVLVAVEDNGSPGTHLPALEKGQLIDIEGPIGSFVLPKLPIEENLLFIGGGTGIAPLRSMLDHALRMKLKKTITLVYSARRTEDFAFMEEFDHYARTGQIKLHQTVTRDDLAWQGARGRISLLNFKAVIENPAETLCFVCGPTAMVDQATSTLNALGVPREAIRMEQWSNKS
tara:strand:- start:342 stop:1061 length:720 start_codon:yes stop_codon:yes gene_type:complete